MHKRRGDPTGRAGQTWSKAAICVLAIMLTAAGCSGGGGGGPSQATPAVSVKGDGLIAGGTDQFNGATATADFYNASTGNFDCSRLGGVNSTDGSCNSTLAQARFYATVTPLPNGQVLIAGGNGPGVICLKSAEVFNPATGSFTSTSNSMFDAHCFLHTGTLLKNGDVLITGGEDETGNLVNTADLYVVAEGAFDCAGLGGVDPNTGFCANTMTDTRFLHTATLLEDGRVLIAGGNDGSITNTAEIFDPATGTFGCSGLGGLNSTTGFCNNTMTDSRQNHTATLILTGPNAGGVLIAGGIDANGAVVQTAELYSPTTGTSFVCSDGSTPGASGCPAAMTTARYLHTATLLDPAYVSGKYAGDILIAGGEDGSGNVLATAEVYDPVAETFTAVGSMGSARVLHTAILLTSGPKRGDVLIAGGVDNAGNTLSSAELFDPRTGQFTATGSMTVARASAYGTGL